MKIINRILAAVLIILVALQIYSKIQTPEKTVKSEPAILEGIAGSELKKVKLTAKAAERLGIETEEVRFGIVPYSSILYDLNGKTWIYTIEEPLTFVRQPIVVDYIEGENVYLVNGPAVKTKVVTVGAAELYGAETGVGK